VNFQSTQENKNENFPPKFDKILGRYSVAEASPALGGGTDPLVAGFKEIGIVAVAEAAEGEISDMMPGAYFFAFSKKAFSSE
jgi:hypothetical protein